MIHPVAERDPSSGEVIPLPSIPKQRNYSDCGIYVMKYMDFFLQGYDIVAIGSWSQEVVDTFRCRITRELKLRKARGISGVRMRKLHGSCSS